MIVRYESYCLGMNSQHRAALRAIANHYEDNPQIPSEDDVAEWVGVRPGDAIDLIDALAEAGYITLMEPVGGFGSKIERSIDGVTRRGEDALADFA